jgi:hypothetical protein
MNDDDFESDLLELCRVWETVGISSGRIPELIGEIGAIRTAAKYAREDARGFYLVGQKLGLEWSLEALVLDYEDADFFPPSVVLAAREKLGVARLTSAPRLLNSSQGGLSLNIALRACDRCQGCGRPPCGRCSGAGRTKDQDPCESCCGDGLGSYCESCAGRGLVEA